MKKHILISLIFFITSCAERSDFSCPATKGKRCLTIAQSDGENVTKNNIEQNIPVLKSITKGEVITEEPTKTFTTTRIIPERTEEIRGKVWFAPFLDEDGNFYDESYVYTILEPKKWKIKTK